MGGEAPRSVVLHLPKIVLHIKDAVYQDHLFSLPKLPGLSLFCIKIFTKMNSEIIPTDPSVAPCYVPIPGIFANVWKCFIHERKNTHN